MKVGGYYTRCASSEDVVINIFTPLITNSMTGGGFITLINSSGALAGGFGSKANFGFNTSKSSNGTVKGTINSIIRRMEKDLNSTDSVLHVYQIKGNAMTSLTVNAATATNAGSATFIGNANIQDVTYSDPTTPEYKAFYKASTLCPTCTGTNSPVVDGSGGATLKVEVLDLGEPGKMDRIAITVNKKDGGIWFYSNWNGTQAVDQQLAGGNIKVSSGFVPGTGLTTAVLTSSQSPSVKGQSVVFKATITQNSGTAVPTGTVAFYNGNKLLGSASVTTVGGVTSASFTTSTLPIGSHTITAYYGGDSRFTSNASSLIQEVKASAILINQAVTMNNVIQDEVADAKFGLTAFPNPSRTQFSVHLESSDRNGKITLRVFDISGRTVGVIPNLMAGQTVQLGNEYRPGIYFVEMIQGKNRTQVKLLKAVD
jgi:hypothetical protein